MRVWRGESRDSGRESRIRRSGWSPAIAARTTPLRFSTALRDHRQGQPRDAGQLARVVLDPDFPDLAAAADLQRPRRAGDAACAYGVEVVGVDFDADRQLAFGDAEHAGGAAEGFGQQYRGTAVQQAIGL